MSEKFSQDKRVARILEFGINHVLAEIEKRGEKGVPEFFCALTFSIGVFDEEGPDFVGCQGVKFSIAELFSKPREKEEIISNGLFPQFAL
jgi:hypothetical protein